MAIIDGDNETGSDVDNKSRYLSLKRQSTNNVTHMSPTSFKELETTAF